LAYRKDIQPVETHATDYQRFFSGTGGERKTKGNRPSQVCLENGLSNRARLVDR